MNNPLYLEFTIDPKILSSLPEDGILLKIQAGMRQEPNEDILNHEHDGYIDPEVTNAGEFYTMSATYMGTSLKR